MIVVKIENYYGDIDYCEDIDYGDIDYGDIYSKYIYYYRDIDYSGNRKYGEDIYYEDINCD